tara:strand:- start:270 stop:866 length:597 start_codon:yes stop_codon:yes gene_type:complete
MSCGPAEKLLELTEEFDEVENTIDSMIADVEGQVGQIQSQIQTEIDKLTDKLVGFIPEIDIPIEVDSLQGDISGILEKLIAGQIIAEDIAQEVAILEAKWGGLDLGNISFTDIPRLLRSGALDLNNICQVIPNYQNSGAEVTLKGTPISFPEVNVADIIKGGSIPRINKPEFRVDVNRRIRNGTNKFLNINIPDLYVD